MVVFAKEKIHSMIANCLFYPGEKNQALSDLSAFGLNRETGGSGLAMIAPHGAWNISGKIITEAFLRTPKPRNGSGITQIVLLGAVHGSREEGIFLSETDYYETPLGWLSVNKELSEEVASCSTLFDVNDIPHLKEHSIEVFLPFIKYRFPDASLVPILLGGARPLSVSTLAKALRIVFGPLKQSTLFIISSNAAMNSDAAKAEEQAKAFLACLEEKQGGPLLDGFMRGTISACGAPLAASLLESGLLDETKAAVTAGSMSRALEMEQTIYSAGVVFEGVEKP